MARGQVTIYIAIAVVILLVFGYLNSIPSPAITPSPPEQAIPDQRYLQDCVEDMASEVVNEFVSMGNTDTINTIPGPGGIRAVFRDPSMIPTPDEAASKLGTALENLASGCFEDPEGTADDLITVETLLARESIQFIITMPVQIKTSSGTVTPSQYHAEVFYPLPTHLSIATQAVSAFDTEGYINVSKLSYLDAEFHLAQGSQGTYFVTQTDPMTDTTYAYAVNPQ